jgi:tetratricopeptide (TPR) repeat protein
VDGLAGGARDRLRRAGLVLLALFALAGLAAFAAMAFVFSIGTATVKTDVDVTVLDLETGAPIPGCLLVFDLDRYPDSRTSSARTDAAGRGHLDAGHHQYAGSPLLPTRRQRTPSLRLYLGEKPRYGTFDEVESWDVRLRFHEPWFAREAPVTVEVQRSRAREDVTKPAPGAKGQSAGFVPIATDAAGRLAQAGVRFDKTADGAPAYRIALTLRLDRNQAASCRARTLRDLETQAVELYNGGRYAEALEAYREAMATGKAAPWANRGLADCLSQLGRDKEAAAAYREAVEADPGDAETLYRYANSLIGENDREAVVQFQKLILREPREARGPIGLANALYDLDRFAEAVRAFNQAQALCATCLSDNDRALYADARRLLAR